MPVRQLLARWNADPNISANIHARNIEDAREALTRPIPDEIHHNLVNALKAFDIQTLFSHQSDAWEALKTGENIVVATGTASGKSLCYNLPVIDDLIKNNSSKALYIFPTKALAQDQLNILRRIISLTLMCREYEHNDSSTSIHNTNFYHDASLTIPIGVYDGDTPKHSRSKIRASSRILITNPDMLHLGILPHHTTWDHFLSNLRFIVIDEMHTYRGVFGSHIANVIRRLRRLLDFYGAKPQFILTSATIGNPEDLAQRLINDKVTVIDNDGSSRGKKYFFIYNPPIIDKDLGFRRSSYQESIRLAQEFLSYEIQAILFCRSRRTVEMILSNLREAIEDPEANPHEIVRGYRSGYLAEERREIERGIRNGDIRVVAATNALELGVDIGGLEAALLIGYPGTIAATRQQAGRAGRGDEEAIAILMATSNPLDQFLASHPEYIFDRPIEHALIDPDNLLILLSHLRCAAFELPFRKGDTYGDVESVIVEEFLNLIAKEGDIHKSGDQYFWMSEQYPAQSISLRTTSPENVKLIQHGNNDLKKPNTIGIIDKASARWMVHPRAIYIHDGDTFYVEDLDLTTNTAILTPINTDYYTLPQRHADIQLIQKTREQIMDAAKKTLADIKVIEQVVGFRKLKWLTHQQIGVEVLDLPYTELLTTSYWISLSESSLTKLRVSGQWRSDPNEYGSNWKTKNKLARSRDLYRCQSCGILESDRAHDVHHKIPFRQFSSSNQANKLENLITLCPSCHRRAETSVRIRSGLVGLAFVLSHLAPLFLMCDRRDIGVHTDPKSSLADGLPTVFIYEQIPAGIGFSQHLYNLHNEIINNAYELVSDCSCQDGCPSCIGPGGEYGSGGKVEALALLQLLIAK
jgi:DEAD/DEAH box helicase domain-containing protein